MNVTENWLSQERSSYHAIGMKPVLSGDGRWHDAHLSADNAEMHVAISVVGIEVRRESYAVGKAVAEPDFRKATFDCSLLDSA